MEASTMGNTTQIVRDRAAVLLHGLARVLFQIESLEIHTEQDKVVRFSGLMNKGISSKAVYTGMHSDLFRYGEGQGLPTHHGANHFRIESTFDLNSVVDLLSHDHPATVLTHTVSTMLNDLAERVIETGVTKVTVVEVRSSLSMFLETAVRMEVVLVVAGPPVPTQEVDA